MDMDSLVPLISSDFQFYSLNIRSGDQTLLNGAAIKKMNLFTKAAVFTVFIAIFCFDC